MNRILLIGMLWCLGLTARAQECREPNPQERALYVRLTTAFDAEILAKCKTTTWNVALDNTSTNFNVANTRPSPERPLFLCSGERRFMILLQNQTSDATVTTHVNSALFKLSFPSGGERATAATRIPLPGASLAYLLTIKDGNDVKYRVIVGLGKWNDISGTYNLAGNVFIDYQFVHHFPASVIENLCFEITGRTKDDVLQIANNIEWTNLNTVLNTQP